MRTLGALLTLMLVVTASVAGSKEQSLEQLKARIETAKPDDRANLCIQIAERQVENADKLYAGGKDDEAQAAIHEVAAYTEQATQAASQTGHKLKNIEIAVRKMTHRLVDIKRSLPFQSQGPVQDAMERLEKSRTELLNRMFGKNPK
jgi:hypothetical protein